MKASIAPVIILGSRGIPASYGGFETVVKELVSVLPENGIALYIACESSLRADTSPPGVMLIYFPVIEPIRIISELFYDVVFLLLATFMSVHTVVLLGYSASPFCLFPRLATLATIHSRIQQEKSRLKSADFLKEDERNLLSILR